MIITNPGNFGTREDSLYPELWVGCIGAWNPSLGQTDQLYDFSEQGHNFPITNTEIWNTYGGFPVFKNFTNNEFTISNFYDTANPNGLAMSFWTNNVIDNNCLFFLGSSYDDQTIECHTFAGSFSFGGYAWPVNINPNTMFLTTLNHFVINYQSNLMNVFLNGQLVGGPIAPTAKWTTAICGLGIGRRAWGMPYISTGVSLTGFMFHNRPLIQSEIDILKQNPNIAYTPSGGAPPSRKYIWPVQPLSNASPQALGIR